MLAALLVFIVVTGLCVGAYVLVLRLPAFLERRKLEQRLREVAVPDRSDDVALVQEEARGPLPVLDQIVSATGTGSWLAMLITQAGVRTTPGAIVLWCVGCGVASATLATLFVRTPAMILVVALVGSLLPLGWLKGRRSARLKRFEEQFPEALDLMSRALRSGHAFQSAMGMVAEELPEPVGAEFKKSFEQQNFGLPLKDSLNELAERVPLIDVRFFVTAVSIQRETGGNLAEILDNLAHVVRERFKILRQVRVHTAHGRFTGYVLLALPAALGLALRVINPEHMQLLFQERIGQTMLMGAIVMQTIGYLWIRRVIRIEV